MRLAVNAAIYDKRPSGLGTYARQLTVALRELHHDLVVYTSRTDDFPWGRRISPRGAPARGWRGHLWRLIWAQTGLRLRLRADRGEVLLNTLPEGPIAPPIPQVTIVHDILPLFFPHDFPRQQWFFRRFVPALLRASTGRIADSVQTAEDVAYHYGIPRETITIVPPGVDHSVFYPRQDAAETVVARFGLRRYVLCVGNVRPHKNLGRLIEAFSRLRTDAVLALVGYRDPRYWPAVARQIERMGLSSRVRALEYVSEEVLPVLYSAALAVAVPSLYEGFGLTILEAMACGAPVIASTAGGLREAAGDVAIVVDPLDPDAMARQLQRVVDDRGLRDELRRRGQAHAAHFTWERTARGVLSVLCHVRSPSPAQSVGEAGGA